MASEIERKFLISEVPEDIEEYDHALIEQGYLSIGFDGSEVRLRRTDKGLFTLTTKTKGDLVRGEWEIYLSESQFNALWPATEDKRIEKTRFSIPRRRETVELDIYAGRLVGLCIAEVEFPDIAAAQEFNPPDWFGPDVTNDAAYKNQQLALHGVSKK